MFPVKHTVIYTFFAITSVQNTCFCSVFNALASKNPAKSCYVQCFFHFWPFFHCRKATKMTQNSISIPSCAQIPKNPRKMSKTPPYSGLGAKPFLAPPAKADIATAILTNVIEHLVLLFCPPVSTPSPPKRCGRIYRWCKHWCFWVLDLRWANVSQPDPSRSSSILCSKTWTWNQGSVAASLWFPVLKLWDVEILDIRYHQIPSDIIRLLKPWSPSLSHSCRRALLVRVLQSGMRWKQNLSCLA